MVADAVLGVVVALDADVAKADGIPPDAVVGTEAVVVQVPDSD